MSGDSVSFLERRCVDVIRNAFMMMLNEADRIVSTGTMGTSTTFDIYSNMLRNVRNWNSRIIHDQTIIAKKRDQKLEYFFKLAFTHLIKNNFTRNIKGEPMEVRINIPPLDNFIHMLFVRTAEHARVKSMFDNPADLESIAKDAMHDALFDCADGYVTVEPMKVSSPYRSSMGRSRLAARIWASGSLA